jgi:hypothetical protein
MLKKPCSFPGCIKPSRKLGLCVGHYEQQRSGRALRPLRSVPPMPERFWAKVRKTETCWLWTASTTEKGYGHFGIGPKIVAAHRWVYEDSYGPIPDGMQIDHICRVRACVNPAHLRLATNKQNRENTVAFSNNAVGIRGVYWMRRERKWQVQVGHHGRRYSGGYFTDVTEAERAAIALRNRLFTHNDTDPKDDLCSNF